MRPIDAASAERAVDVTEPDPAVGPAQAIALATRTYGSGRPLDMSALAAELGIGRATLYRWVGNRESLLSDVLATGTEQTFRAAVNEAQGDGAELIIDVLRRFCSAVVANPALIALTRREPLVFVRLATMPGPIEQRAAAMIEGLLIQETGAGHLAISLPPAVLALTIVRLTDAHLYAHLLGRKESEIETGLDLVALLLRGQAVPVPVPVGRPREMLR